MFDYFVKNIYTYFIGDIMIILENVKEQIEGFKNTLDMIKECLWLT